MPLEARKKVEMMKEGATIRPLVSFAVEEAVEVFRRCSNKRTRLLVQGCNPPFFLEEISDDSILDALSIIKPITDQRHIITIIDHMDTVFLNHTKNIPKPVN